MEPLFSINLINDDREIKSLISYSMKKLFWFYIIFDCSVLLFQLIFWRTYAFVILMLFVELLICIFQKANLKKEYASNKLFSNAEFTIDFYDNYLVKRNENYNVSIPYDKLYDIVETKTHFYFKQSKSKIIINIPLADCSPELYNYIRYSIKAKYFAGVKNRTLIKSILLFVALFAVCVATWAAPLLFIKSADNLLEEGMEQIRGKSETTTVAGVSNEYGFDDLAEIEYEYKSETSTLVIYKDTKGYTRIAVFANEDIGKGSGYAIYNDDILQPSFTREMIYIDDNLKFICPDSPVDFDKTDTEGWIVEHEYITFKVGADNVRNTHFYVMYK